MDSRIYGYSSLALARAARLPAAGRWLLHRVERCIDGAAIPQLMPGAERLEAILECNFDGAAPPRDAGWAAFEQAQRDSGALLFTLDTVDHRPIPASGAALDGGWRRWTPLRRAAPTVDAFAAAWAGRHAELVKHLPRIHGYIQQLVQASSGPPVVDGIAQLCFPDEAAMLEAYASKARDGVRDDALTLLSGSATWLVEGRRLR